MRSTLRYNSAAFIVAAALTAGPLVSAEARTAVRAEPAPLNASANAVPGQYIVTLDKGVAPATLAKQALPGVATLHTYNTVLNGFAAKLTPAQVDKIRNTPGVAAVTEDSVTTAAAPAPAKAQPVAAAKAAVPALSRGLDRIDQQDNWDRVNGTGDGQFNLTATASNVTVYVVDSGINIALPEFGGRATRGFNAVVDGQQQADCYGQGTAVASTIGGNTYGVARQAKLVAVRVLGCQGTGTAAGLIAGMDYVAAQARLQNRPALMDVSVVLAKNALVDTAAQVASGLNVLPVVAAGNQGQDACFHSPASVSQVLAVAGSNKFDEESSFTNYGSCVSIYAPGVDITAASATGGGAVRTGTQMAAAHTAGVAALYKGNNPNATPSDIAEFLDTESTMDVLTNISKASPNALLYTGGLSPPPAPGRRPCQPHAGRWAAGLLASRTPNPSTGAAESAHRLGATRPSGRPQASSPRPQGADSHRYFPCRARCHRRVDVRLLFWVALSPIATSGVGPLLPCLHGQIHYGSQLLPPA
ncbi:S8 family peptidase [Streptomyces sp. H021]|uniref:S8 family peptidase n=1 Tax=Streptomyces sp. H021 TaxID=1519486 RepID=UPI0006AF64DD|nr:S8 family peptidase [Streptomyces sp. H021]